MTSLITEPTQITDTSHTLLDIILTNQPDLFKNAGVSDIGLSDHCMVYGFLKETVKKHTAAMINFRSFKFLDMEEFKKDLEEAVWFKQDVIGIDEVYDNWHTECMRIVDKHLPLKRVKAQKTDVPYMTGEWKEAIWKKRKYAKKFSQSKTKENMELMKKWCNNAARLRRKAIKNYWNAICEDMNNNPRKFYNTFTPFLRTKLKKDKSIISLTIQGVTHQDQSLVAQEFTSFFCSIADHIGGTDVCGLTEALCYQHQSISNIAARHAPNTFSFRRLNRDEVLAALREINPRKANRI